MSAAKAAGKRAELKDIRASDPNLVANISARQTGCADHAPNTRIWLHNTAIIIRPARMQIGGYFAFPGRSSRRAAEPRSDRLPSLTESRNVSLARGCRSI